jgi:hypothetical protein
MVASLLATVAGLLLLLTAGTLVKNAQLRQALKQSDDALWVSFRDQARAIRFSGRQGQRFEGLEAIRKALRLPLPAGHSLDELRNQVIACLSVPDVEVLHEWEGRPNGTGALAFDDRLETYARVESPGLVSVRRMAEDTEIAPLATRINDPSLLLSPDGRFLQLRPAEA